MTTPYKVDQTSQANQQAEAIFEWAKTKGRGAEFLALIARIFNRLKRNPLRFGEPQYNARHPGGTPSAMRFKKDYPFDLSSSKKNGP